MHARPASLLLIASATVLSYISVLAGEVVLPFYRVIVQPKSLAELRTFIPSVTLFACDHLPFLVGLLVTACLTALTAVWYLPNKVGQSVSVGLCTQWLIVWAAAFCFCYSGFLGGVSMHHPQFFEFDQFMTLEGGIFPVSLALIILTLIFSLWPDLAFKRASNQTVPSNPLIEDIRRRLGETPFRLFTIVTSDETKYRVPSRAHISLGPQGTRLVVWSDRGSGNSVAASHVARLEDEAVDSTHAPEYI